MSTPPFSTLTIAVLTYQRVSQVVGLVPKLVEQAGTVNATVPRSPEKTRPFLIRPSRAGERDWGLRSSRLAMSAVLTARSAMPSPRSAIATM